MKLRMTCDFLRDAIVQLCGEPPNGVTLRVTSPDEDETHEVDLQAEVRDATYRIYAAKVREIVTKPK